MSDRCKQVESSNINSLLSSVDIILFDCDGTLWRGDDVLPGAIELVNQLNNIGKRVGFATNNSCRTQPEMIEELTRRGFLVREPELVLCTAHSTVIYLAEKLQPNSNVFLVAPPSLSKELNALNINTLTDKDFDGNFDHLQAQAVVCALDRTFNYRRFAIATHLLISHRDCLFVATNLDATFPESGGRLSPDCGAIAAAVSTATGREVDVCIGKPSSIMFEQVAKKLNLDAKKTLMVGDRCETDMAFASAIGARSLMLLTGVSTTEDAKSFAASNDKLSLAPHFIAPSVEFLSKLLNG